jgi:hypothetical protein
MLGFSHQMVCQGQNDENHSPTSRDRSIETKSNQLTPLAAVIQIAIANQIPLGIVLGAQPRLCDRKLSFNIKADSVEGALSQALQGTGYVVSQQNHVYVLMPPDATSHELSLLDYRFDRFSATGYTISGAGAMLGGYITSVAEKGGGFAVDAISSISAHKFDIKMTSATTLEIANHIVSLPGKGVWIFHPTVHTVPISAQGNPITIYGYDDDATSLGGITCESEAGDHR